MDVQALTICRWHFSSTGFATRQRLNGPEPVKERSANGNLKDSARGSSSFPVPWLWTTRLLSGSATILTSKASPHFTANIQTLLFTSSISMKYSNFHCSCQLSYTHHQSSTVSTVFTKTSPLWQLPWCHFQTKVLYTWMDLRFSCWAFHDLPQLRASTEPMCIHISYKSKNTHIYIYIGIHTYTYYAFILGIVWHFFTSHYPKLQNPRFLSGLFGNTVFTRDSKENRGLNRKTQGFPITSVLLWFSPFCVASALMPCWSFHGFEIPGIGVWRGLQLFRR